jgi:hypothetical protein
VAGDEEQCGLQELGRVEAMQEDEGKGGEPFLDLDKGRPGMGSGDDRQ